MAAIARWAAFPLLAVVMPAAGLALWRTGLDPAAATFVTLVIGVGLVAWLERLIPYEPSWRRPQGDVGLDSAYLLLTLVVASVTQALVAAAAGAFASHARVGPWPGGWPLALQIALALVVSDLGIYAVHRASHRSGGVLWRIHSVHHSAERMYWLNGARFHPANVVYNVALKAAPLALLGATPDAIVGAGLVSGLLSFVSHANLDLRTGPLNKLFSTPEIHRWHHARNLRDANANYGGTLLVWDLVFGTWSLPERRLGAGAVGLQDAKDYPAGLRQQLLLPVRCCPGAC